MAFLQFLTGSRDQQFEELNPQASLVVGSAPDAHIKVNDPGIEGKHCQVYPAQNAYWLQDLGAGSTIMNMKRISSATEQIRPGDVFILGRTFVKLWDKKPAGGGGGGGGGGADPAALEAAQQELAQVKQELESLQSSAGESGERASQLESQVSELQEELEQARAQVTQLESDMQSKLAEAQEELSSALEASRAAVEAIRAEQERQGHGRLEAAAEPSKLRQALDALGVSDGLRAGLERAVTAEIDRQVLRRLKGPVVPLRDLAALTGSEDLARQVEAVRRRGEQIEAARDLGLHTLESGDLERLLEMARG